MEPKLTRAERGTVRRLLNLANTWPDGWWLETSTLGASIMRYDEKGQPEYIATVDMPTSGGQNEQAHLPRG